MRLNTGKPKTSGPGDKAAICTKVLIVEDSEDFSTFIRELLDPSGYTILPTISSGEDALRVAGNSRPDIVLVDVGLGGIVDGIESGGRIAEELGIPVIFLSGYTDERALERAKTKKPSGYLVKPFNKAELRASIEIALYRHRTEEAADTREEAPNGGSEAKELRDQIVKLETEICEYREIIDYLNKSLNELIGTEGTRFLKDEVPAPADIKPSIELEFESE